MSWWVDGLLHCGEREISHYMKLKPVIRENNGLEIVQRYFVLMINLVFRALWFSRGNTQFCFAAVNTDHWRKPRQFNHNVDANLSFHSDGNTEVFGGLRRV